VSQQFGIGLETSSVDRITLRSATSTLPSDAQVVGQEEGEG
jgi:hypothetical protein